MKTKLKVRSKENKPKRKSTLPPFDYKKNLELVQNQHIVHNIFRKLVSKNGPEVYIKDVERRRKVVQHYLKEYNLIGTSVESFWRTGGSCILIGKGW